MDQRFHTSGYPARSHQRCEVSKLAWKLGRWQPEQCKGALVPLQGWSGFGHWSFSGTSGIWERSCESSCPFLLVAVVVSCCQTSVQEMSSGTVVAFVQPERVVRGLFAFGISLTKRLQIGGRAGLISHVCFQALGLSGGEAEGCIMSFYKSLCLWSLARCKS